MTPTHEGAVSLDVWGESVRVRFDWRALSALRASLGDGWADRVETAFAEQDAVTMADILAAGSDRPAEWWLEASPPLVTSAAAARKALLAAFYGPTMAADPDPLTAASRTKSSRIATWFAALFGRGARSAATLSRSGA